MSPDVIGVWVGAILTLFVFSYLLGDTPLFRLAQAIFVGVTVGYATTAAIDLVLWPRLFMPLVNGETNGWVLFVPLILGVLLLLKLRPPWAAFGNIPIAFLFGVGSALAIGGALSGALLPQLRATMVSLTLYQNLDTWMSSLLLAFGTIGALLSFRFVIGGARPAVRLLDTIGRGWGYAGRWFILIAFGAIFAGTSVSRVSLLVSRVYFLLHDWLQIVH